MPCHAPLNAPTRKPLHLPASPTEQQENFTTETLSTVTTSTATTETIFVTATKNSRGTSIKDLKTKSQLESSGSAHNFPETFSPVSQSESASSGLSIKAPILFAKPCLQNNFDGDDTDCLPIIGEVKSLKGQSRNGQTFDERSFSSELTIESMDPLNILPTYNLMSSKQTILNGESWQIPVIGDVVSLKRKTPNMETPLLNILLDANKTKVSSRDQAKHATVPDKKFFHTNDLTNVCPSSGDCGNCSPTTSSEVNFISKSTESTKGSTITSITNKQSSSKYYLIGVPHKNGFKANITKIPQHNVNFLQKAFPFSSEKQNSISAFNSAKQTYYQSTVDSSSPIDQVIQQAPIIMPGKPENAIHLINSIKKTAYTSNLVIHAPDFGLQKGNAFHEKDRPEIRGEQSIDQIKSDDVTTTLRSCASSHTSVSSYKQTTSKKNSASQNSNIDNNLSVTSIASQMTFKTTPSAIVKVISTSRLDETEKDKQTSTLSSCLTVQSGSQKQVESILPVNRYYNSLYLRERFYTILILI